MNPFWSDFLKLLAAFFLGSGGLKLMEIIGDKSKFKRERKAVKEDRKEEKEDEVKALTKKVDDLTDAVKEMNEQMSAFRDAQKCVLLDRIIHLGQSFIQDGEISFDNRRRLREMHDSYHNGLKGNGDADAIMKAVDALPLKNHN